MVIELTPMWCKFVPDVNFVLHLQGFFLKQPPYPPTFSLSLFHQPLRQGFSARCGFLPTAAALNGKGAKPQATHKAYTT